MATKQGPLNQHQILHQHYPNDCCLCKAEQSLADFQKSIPTEVWIVGIGNGDGSEVKSIHRSHSGALESWNKLRLYLINDVNDHIIELAADNERYKTNRIPKMYEDMLKNLLCENPEEIDNYPHSTPYIEQMILED